jgi:alkyldihydroxyacetonephosphate synthase
MLLGAAGEPEAVAAALGAARSVVRRHSGVPLGRRPGRHWKHDRFRHPYLRDGLLDLGYATDTLETAIAWSKVASARRGIRRAIADALTPSDDRVAVLCHVSHPYPDGASLYFTFFFRCSAAVEETVERWAVVKRAANQALVSHGATLSHHHGVGQWHAPLLAEEIGTTGHHLLRTAATEMDPAGILNPHVLLDPEDHLED